MCDNFIPLSHCTQDNNSDHPIAMFKGEPITKQRFIADVKSLVVAYSDLNSERVALYYEEAYPFCVSFYALLHSGKRVWIASNNNIETAGKLIEQDCLLVGEWQDKESLIAVTPGKELVLEPLSLNESFVTIYTSGSSGDPKAINKSLRQLQTEITVLEQQWGQKLAQATVLATVSHQHIYGLLFRLLWPLAAGRCFHSQMYLSPEPLLKVVDESPFYWVASPAQLKRLDEQTEWQKIKKLKAIFSSGGVLVESSAIQIYENCKQKVIEVYGSSETGGIAWRQMINNTLWTSFNNVEITEDKEGRHWLSSPFLSESELLKADTNNEAMIKLDDKIELDKEGRFTLLGRVDRIVKVEEKRLSLDQLENSLNRSEWVDESYALLLTEKRDKIATVLVLTEKGQSLLRKLGRKAFISQLRKQLMQSFETVVLPRKWLFMQSIPLTSQGKIDRPLLKQLFSLDSDRFPQIQNCNLQCTEVEIQVKIQAGLIYFNGHFPDQPILPGVTQLAWVEKYGHLFFNIEQPFLRMEVIKFKKIIQPGDFITMKLRWNEAPGKLYFSLNSDSDLHSSGRMVYGIQVA